MSRPPTFNRLIFFLSLSLVTVFVVSACAPAAPAAPTQAAAPATEPSLPAATQTPETAAQPTLQAASTPLAVATSRGPNLEASDPSTVSLASGGLQLVEFFRFT
jgi:hypothetical protein